MLLHLSIAGAQTSASFPSVHLNSKTLRAQEQAEEVFERRDYGRAFSIYRDDLAPIGDKYAQYMVGFMHLTGKGTGEDRVAASAWYRLSAERGTKEFVGARDRLMRTLDEPQKTESDRQYIALRKEYGDLILLANALRRDLAEFRTRTGSRIASATSPIAIVDINRSGTTRSGTEYYAQIERRIQLRLDYIRSKTKIDIIDMNLETINPDQIEQRISAYLEIID